MADTFEGTLNVRKTTRSQYNQTISLNTADAKVSESTTGRTRIDMEGLSGTVVINERKTRSGEIDFRNSKAANVPLEIDPNIKQSFWLRDASTDAFTMFLKPTGGPVTEILPQFRWVRYRVRDTLRLEPLAGWMDDVGSSLPVFVADYQVVAGRPLKVFKNGTDRSTKGGRITLEGSVEETTTVPAAGDTITTLPSGHRPAHTIAFAVLAEPASATNVDVVIVEILTTGAVVLRSLLLWTAAVNVPIDLSGIEFFAAN